MLDNFRNDTWKPFKWTTHLRILSSEPFVLCPSTTFLQQFFVVSIRLNMSQWSRLSAQNKCWFGEFSSRRAIRKRLHNVGHAIASESRWEGRENVYLLNHKDDGDLILCLCRLKPIEGGMRRIRCHCVNELTGDSSPLKLYIQQLNLPL